LKKEDRLGYLPVGVKNAAKAERHEGRGMFQDFMDETEQKV
jgi:hypothetical protein